MIFVFWSWVPFGSHFGGVLGAQMEAKAFKKALQKNIKNIMPKMTPNWSQRGSQNGAKIIKNEVLEAPCFKGALRRPNTSGGRRGRLIKSLAYILAGFWPRDRSHRLQNGRRIHLGGFLGPGDNSGLILGHLGADPLSEASTV